MTGDDGGLRPRQDHPRHGRAARLSNEIYSTRRDGGELRKRGEQGAVGAGHLDGQCRAQQFLLDLEGQITGVFGLIGSGRTETFKIVSGIYKRDFLRGGEIELDGQAGALPRAGEAVRDGIVYVTEDRKIEGFFETMSIAENLYSGLLAAGLRARPWMSACARCSALAAAMDAARSTSGPSTTMRASSSCPAATSRRW